MSPDIHLYTAQTPNGIKISITLNELGLPYEFTRIDISKNTRKRPWFLDINPNGRIPALTDTFTDRKPIRVFESGSIMQYLIEKYDKDYKLSFPLHTREHIEMTSWLFFVNSGVGPMQGQSNHFTRYAPEHIPYGVNQYQNETKRLYSILDKHLADKEYLVGNKCTIADIAHWGWVSAAAWAGVDIEKFPNLKAWEARMWARPGVKKGANVPDREQSAMRIQALLGTDNVAAYEMKELLADKEKMEQRAAQRRVWVQQGMKEDAEKHK